jgi:hypothetical protein
MSGWGSGRRGSSPRTCGKGSRRRALPIAMGFNAEWAKPLALAVPS